MTTEKFTYVVDLTNIARIILSIVPNITEKWVVDYLYYFVLGILLNDDPDEDVLIHFYNSLSLNTDSPIVEELESRVYQTLFSQLYYQIFPHIVNKEVMGVDITEHRGYYQGFIQTQEKPDMLIHPQ